ncbi:MAG: hypothetical protein M3441_20910 [Chloroflexota bacterium]|nr:hypothetical protein [Chloroflexota bacterium]
MHRAASENDRQPAGELAEVLVVERMVTFIGVAQATAQALHEAFQIRSGQLVAP